MPQADPAHMTKERESFVLWVDATTENGRPRTGTVEWVRMSERFEFSSVDELARFIERCIARADVDPARADFRFDRP